MLVHCSATKEKGPLFRVYFYTVSNALSTLKIPIPASPSPIPTFTETQNYTSVVLIFCVFFCFCCNCLVFSYLDCRYSFGISSV